MCTVLALALCGCSSSITEGMLANGNVSSKKYLDSEIKTASIRSIQQLPKSEVERRKSSMDSFVKEVLVSLKKEDMQNASSLMNKWFPEASCVLVHAYKTGDPYIVVLNDKKEIINFEICGNAVATSNEEQKLAFLTSICPYTLYKITKSGVTTEQKTIDELKSL